MNLQKLYVRGRRLIETIKKNVAWHLGHRKTTYVWDRVSFYREIWRSTAERNALQFVPLTNDVWELRNSDDRCVARINNCYVELDDPVTLHIAADKALTYSLLSAAGLPVAPHTSFTLDSLHLLREFVQQHAGPFVVKPASGTGSGIGVTTHIDTYRRCVNAAALASLYCRGILVEQFVAGEVYRLLFVNNEFISGVRRTGLRIEGDGKSTVGELIAVRYSNLANIWQDDLDLRATTRTQGLTESTVLPAGKIVLIKSVTDAYRSNIEIRTVYTNDVTHNLSADIIEDAKRTSQILRSEFCGIDLILLDPEKSLRDGNGVIGEVNTTPGLHHHYKLPGADQRKDVADTVLRHILRSSRNG